MKQKIVFALIVILSIALRFYRIGNIPNGIYSDEVAYAYNAYSILNTGRDEYGTPYPLAFQSFGDYKTPLYIYFFVPFIALFGMNDISTRMPSAVLGVVSVVLLFQLAKTLRLGNRTALLSGFFIAVLPFGLQFHRMAHENTLVVVLVMLGLLFFFQSWHYPKRLIVAAVAFSLSIYTYHDARVFTPFFLLLLCFIYRNHLLKHIRISLVAASVFFLLLMPLIGTFVLTREAAWSRPARTIIFSDKGIIYSIEATRSVDRHADASVGRLFHNKPVHFSLKFFENYLLHFSPQFLFFSGDPVKIYHTIGSGVLLLVLAPVLLFGVAIMLIGRVPHAPLLVGWVLVAPIAASLTRFVPSASRTLLLAPVLTVLIAIGTLTMFRYVRHMAWYGIFLLAFTGCFIGNFSYYLHMYYVHTPLVYANEWHYGMGEVMRLVSDRQQSYDTVWFSKKAWGYMYPLYYLKYPPEKYQPQAHVGPPDEYGFGWVNGFDRYIFDRTPKYFDFDKQILYITGSGEVPKHIRPIQSIDYPNGDIAFEIFDTASIKKYCPIACAIQMKPENENIYGDHIL